VRLALPPRTSRLLGWGCLLVLVAGAAWLVVTAFLAKSRLQAIAQQLPALRSAISSGDFDHAREIETQLRHDASTAHSLTSGPAWSIAANLPFAGEPLRTARGLATQSDAVASGVVPSLLDLADTLKGSSLRHGANIDLSVLQEAAPRLASAAATASHAATAIGRGTSASTWLGVADDARDKAVTSLAQLSDELAGASNTVATLLPMLGEDGARRYFVGFMNEAEARGLGGLPGAFAIVTADHGTIAFTHFGSDTELDGQRAAVELGSDFDSRYGPDDPTGAYVNSDISPNFPDAAQIWAGMWQAKSGQHVDGALAIDPTALSYLLRVVGPTTLTDGGALNAGNVVALTQQKVYAAFSDNAQRKAYLVSVAHAAAGQVIKGGGTPIDLVHAISRAAGERRLLAWSSHPDEQSRIEAAGYGGVLGSADGPYAGFTVVNAAGTKLDYYLARSMTYRRASCAADSTVIAALTLTNGAPRSGLPEYVTGGGSGNPAPGKSPGDNRVIMSFYATPGARIAAVRLDDTPVRVAATTERGLTVISVPVPLPVGEARTLTVTYADPRGGSATILRQPLVEPMTIDATPACS